MTGQTCNYSFYKKINAFIWNIISSRMFQAFRQWGVKDRRRAEGEERTSSSQAPIVFTLVRALPAPRPHHPNAWNRG